MLLGAPGGAGRRAAFGATPGYTTGCYWSERRLPMPSRRAMVAAVGAAFLVTAGLGFRHVGVEQQWWPGPDTCTATGADAQTTDELLDAIMNAPLVRCDELPASLLGLSIAGWVVVSALALAGLAAVVLARSRGVAR